jgi:DNA-binding transcriptional MerR regulator
MKIGEVAKRVGVSVSTLRMYEQRGLIAANRSPGGTRKFSDSELARFHAIVGLTRAEVPIDTLARLSHIRQESATGDTASRQVDALLKETETALMARIATMRSALLDLRRAQGGLVGCHGCLRQPTVKNCSGCPVAEKLLACPVMHVVWDQEVANG